MSVTTASWSESPGMLTEDLVSVGLVVNTRSSMFCSRVGDSWI